MLWSTDIPLISVAYTHTLSALCTPLRLREGNSTKAPRILRCRVAIPTRKDLEDLDWLSEPVLRRAFMNVKKTNYPYFLASFKCAAFS